jgi:hypothetical protein
VKLDIVAKAPATGACGVLDDGSVHSPPAYQSRDCALDVRELDVSTYTTGGSKKQDPPYAAEEFDLE